MLSVQAKRVKKAKKVKTLENLDAQIRQIQQALAALGPMRPGTLSRQYRRPQQRRGAYYQISYTFQMRSHTEYVRPEEVPQLRGELAQYKRYKELTARWVALSLRRAKLRIKEARGAGTLPNRPEGPPQALSSGESWPLKSEKA
jgi:hypothetical protein